MRVIVAIGLLLFAIPSAADTRQAGRVLGTVTFDTGADFALEQGAAARVQLVADDTVRVRFAPSGQFTARVSGAVVPGGTAAATVYDTAAVTYVIGSRITVVVLKDTFRVVAFRADGSLIQADLDPAVTWDTTTGAVVTTKWSPPDEHYFGLGERGGPLDRRGRQFAMRNVDWAAYGEFSDPLYVSIPFFWGMRGGKAYGLFLDNPAMPFFQFDADGSGSLKFGAGAGELDYYLFAGPQPAEVSAAYGHVAGMPALPPKWSLGYHQSRYGYASADEILHVASTLRAQQIPADAIHFDIDHLDRLQMFTWNAATFPDPVAMNATLEQLGFKRVNISEPLVRTDDRLFPYLAASNFLVTRPDGNPNVTDIWFGSVGWFDFTRSTAARWYIDVLKSFLSTGISATWNDLNEPAANYMVDGIYDFDGERRTDLEARNIYALRESTASYEAQLELRPNVRPWILSRSGYAGIQRYAANWGGDQSSSFDSMRVSVQMASSMALSGQNQYGHDIGGFLGSPSPELFIRWLQLGSFTTFFRNHAINTSQPREPWAFGEPYLSMARDIINERYRLMPYLYSLMAHAAFTGVPALTPTLFQFPGDQTTYAQDTDFMLGPSLLIAPVLAEGAWSRTVYLPAGADWYDTASDTKYVGGINVIVVATLGQIPVFARAGAVIPKGPVVQFTGQQPLIDVHVQLYPGPATRFDLYEDDGESFDYVKGHYLTTSIARSDTASGMMCHIERSGGDWVPPAGRSWWLEAHAFTTPSAVIANGMALPRAATEDALQSMTQGWVKRDDGRVIVRVQDSSAAIDVEVRK